jgi:hypothetical protein
MMHLMPYLSSLRPTYYALETREEAVNVVGTGVELEGAKIYCQPNFRFHAYWASELYIINVEPCASVSPVLYMLGD